MVKVNVKTFIEYRKKFGNFGPQDDEEGRKDE